MKYISFTSKFKFAILILLVSACTNKQYDLGNTIQSALDSELTENNPGILVNISSLSTALNWTGAAGVADIETNTKLLPNQTFRIASVTKTFVAATILRLWEDGKLSLDDPITKSVSKEHIEILREGGYQVDKIFIRHLLTHSAGLADHSNSYKFKVDFMKEKHVWTRTEQINDLIEYTEPLGEVGEQYKYSDTGYVLLGEIIEKVTEKSMGEAMAEQLNLKGLGINDTYMEDFDGDFTGSRAHQYYKNVDTYDFHPSLDYYGGGGLLSTTADLSLFFQSLFNHKVFKNKSTLDTMLTPVKYDSEQALDYRMGIWKIDLEGKTAYTHIGFWGTQVVYIPETKTTISTNYSQRWTQRGNAPIILKIVEIIE